MQKQTSSIGAIGLGSIIDINFCTSCSYRFLLIFFLNLFNTKQSRGILILSNVLLT